MLLFTLLLCRGVEPSDREGEGWGKWGGRVGEEVGWWWYQVGLSNPGM